MTQTEKLSQLAREGARKRSMNINDNDGTVGGQGGGRKADREGVWGLKQIMVTPPHSRHSWKLLRSVCNSSARLDSSGWSGLVSGVEVLWLYQRT